MPTPTCPALPFPGQPPRQQSPSWSAAALCPPAGRHSGLASAATGHCEGHCWAGPGGSPRRLQRRGFHKLAFPLRERHTDQKAHRSESTGREERKPSLGPSMSPPCPPVTILCPRAVSQAWDNGIKTCSVRTEVGVGEVVHGLSPLPAPAGASLTASGQSPECDGPPAGSAHPPPPPASPPPVSSSRSRA